MEILFSLCIHIKRDYSFSFFLAIDFFLFHIELFGFCYLKIIIITKKGTHENNRRYVFRLVRRAAHTIFKITVVYSSTEEDKFFKISFFFFHLCWISLGKKNI
jgi:hypothetical protein